jgi:hypothetical protein
MRLPCTSTRTGVAFAEDQRATGGLGPGGKQESTEAARPPANTPAAIRCAALGSADAGATTSKGRCARQLQTKERADGG